MRGTGCGGAGASSRWYRPDRDVSSELLVKLLAGTSDQNIAFAELVSLLRHLGFELRTVGSHHIFTMQGIAEILNLQPRHDGTAKPYQLKQVRQLITMYRLAGDDDAI